MSKTNQERWPEYYNEDGSCAYTCPIPDRYRAKAFHSHARCCGCAVTDCHKVCRPQKALMSACGTVALYPKGAA